MKARVTLLLSLLISLSLQSQDKSWITYWDTLTFEQSIQQIEIDTAQGNLWQIGIPQKTIFDSAFTAPYAILTDTINSYAVNSNSSFVFKFDPASYYEVHTTLKFKHKFDTDTLLDYGLVEVSYDSGATWTLLAGDTTYDLWWGRENSFYGVVDIMKPSGKSQGWVTDYYMWTWFYPVAKDKPEWDYWPDHLWVRFTFISDSIQNYKEGWMIDNIEVFAEYYSGIDDKTKSNQLKVYPQPANDRLIIDYENTNNECLSVSIYTLSGKCLKTFYPDRNTIDLDVSFLENGLYIYRIINETAATINSGKFIIAK